MASRRPVGDGRQPIYNKEEVAIDERELATPGVADQLAALHSAVDELRDGQDELLRMYEELGTNYPRNCICARMREQARAEVLGMDVFAAEIDRTDYQPDA